MPARQRRGCSDLRARRGIASKRPLRKPPLRDSEFIALRTFPRSESGIADLAEVRAAVPGKGMMAVQNRRAKRGTARTAAAMVPAAKMRVTEAVAAAAVPPP